MQQMLRSKACEYSIKFHRKEVQRNMAKLEGEGAIHS